LFFRWKAQFTEDNRDAFFHEFIHWLKQPS
jgi:hypothetical protein